MKKGEPKSPVELMRFGGRTYRTCQQTTYRQDIFVQGLISKAGVSNTQMFKGADESAIDFANRMVATVVESGLATAIIGGLIECIEFPMQGHWTQAYAEGIAEHLDNLTDRDEKQALNDQLASLVAGFFVSALRSQMTFLKSSDHSAQPEPKPLHPPSNAAH